MELTSDFVTSLVSNQSKVMIQENATHVVSTLNIPEQGNHTEPYITTGLDHSNMTNAVTATMEVTSDFITTLVSNASREMTQENSHFMTTLSTTWNNTDSGNHTEMYSTDTLDESSVITFLKLYLAPMLLFIGTLGNIMSFVVFSRPVLKHSATAFYFRVLAAADTLALNVGLWPNWMRDAFDIHIYPMTDISCRIQTYLRYMLPDFAIWVLVILTIERMVGVKRPYRVHSIFTRRRIWISVFITLLAISMVNIPSIWITTKNLGDTSIHPCAVAHEVLAYEIWPWIDLTVYSLLPFFIMITSITIILKSINRQRRTLCRQDSLNSNMGVTTETMTPTLLTVVFVTFLLTTPFVIYAVIMKELHGKVNIDFLLYYYIASYLRYVNNSINFFLYCCSGKKFRAELRYLCSGRRRRLSSSGSDFTYIPAGRGTLRSTGIDTIRYTGKDTTRSSDKTSIGSAGEPPAFFELSIPPYTW